MRLTKSERETVRMRFNGRCAYCGEPLGPKWHADHLEPVVRETRYEQGRGFVPTGTLLRPHLDVIENLMPACIPCNIDKGPESLESWRAGLQRSLEVLHRNHPTYRHAKRFGLVVETGATIRFHFEIPAQ